VIGRNAGDETIRLSKRGFGRWLRRRVASRVPAAVVRFGDGEVRLLEAGAGDDESMRAAMEQLERDAGGGFAPATALDVKATLAHARDRADVLGILVIDPLSAGQMTWTKRLANLHAERLAAGNPPEALARNALHHEILAELPEILAGRPVSVISCRDVKPVIEARWGLDDVAIYQVPSHHASREFDGAYEAALHDVPIWPDAHERVRAELTVREPGEVFLVGAGLFGKDLCVLARERGAIAIDMGAALDHVAGKVTREPMRQMLELHEGGAPAAAIAARMEERYGVQLEADTVMEFVDTVSLYVR